MPMTYAYSATRTRNTIQVRRLMLRGELTGLKFNTLKTQEMQSEVENPQHLVPIFAMYAMNKRVSK